MKQRGLEHDNLTRPSAGFVTQICCNLMFWWILPAGTNTVKICHLGENMELTMYYEVSRFFGVQLHPKLWAQQQQQQQNHLKKCSILNIDEKCHRITAVAFVAQQQRQQKQQQAVTVQPYLKGHGNEADFLGFLQKLVPSRGVGDSPTRRVGELMTRRLGKSGSRLLNV